MPSIKSLVQTFIAAGLVLALLAACGQRGPLYLPDKRPSAAPTQQKQATGEEQKDSQEGEDEEGP
jgi:predicted small lipoprotein YifL